MARNAPPVETESSNPMDDRIEQLMALFPEAVTEDGLDFDVLRNLLGIQFPQKERYQFTWAGKQEALLSLQKRSKGTLKPVPEESVNWDSTGHLFIEGDNLEVLKLLYKSYFGRVKMIYIDPPYNTGGDFVYPDNYADPLGEYLRMTGQVDENGNTTTSRQEVNGRKHSAWLSMMYPRLFLARQMLQEDGLLFVSIDDNESYNLRLLLNEIFGEDNFIACLVWRKRKGGGNDSNFVAYDHDYVVMFAKNKIMLDQLFTEYDEAYAKRYNEQDEIGEYYWDTFRRKAGKQYYPITCPDGTVLQYDAQGNPISWLRSEKRFYKDVEAGEIRFVQTTNSWSVQFKQRKPKGKKPRSLLLENGLNSDGSDELLSFFNTEVFDTPKPVNLIRSLSNIILSANNHDLVLDFFAGSSTTAQAVLELNREDRGNRRFIMVQLPESTGNPDYPTIADIGKERIRRVIHRMIDERNGKLEGFEQHPDEDLGFRVFKLDASSMRQWPDLPADTTTPEEYARQLEMFVKDPLLEGWTIDDVIAEVAIKETGFSLSYRVEQVAEVTDLTVYRVIDDEKEQFFYICLDDKLSLDALKPLNLQPDDLLIFRDSAITDTIVANLVLTCRIKSI